jgi:hypothetical protein
MPRAAAPPAAFEVPSKRIGSEEDLRRFLDGGTAKDFVAFILSLNQAVTGARGPGARRPPAPGFAWHALGAARSGAWGLGWLAPGLWQGRRAVCGSRGFCRQAERRSKARPLPQPRAGKKLSAPRQLSRPLAALVAALDSLRAWVDEIPPAQQSLRYGNPAYRTWFARMAAAAPGLVRDVLPPELHGAVLELTPYLVDSFGNATRIDYGTGHETTFAALLYCLAALGVVGDNDREALVNVVFDK